MVNKPKKSAPKIGAPRARAVPPPPPNLWESYARKIVLLAGALAAGGTLWAMLALLARSDVPPLAGIARVDKVDSRVSTVGSEEDAAHMKFLERIDALADSQRKFGAWQQSQIATALVNRVNNLKLALRNAEKEYAQSPTPENARVLETLQMALDAAQLQMREMASAP